jgi:hypothetical protein
MPKPEPLAPQTWVVGPLRVNGPLRMGKGKWSVIAVDSMTEETAEKVFDTAGKAQTFIDELVGGAPPVDPLVEAAPEIVNPSPNALPLRPIVTTATPATLTRRHTRQVEGAGGPGQGEKDPDAAPFNLKAVRDALVDAEFDPFVELTRVLKEDAAVVKNGEAVLGADGKPLRVHAIRGIDRAKILVELGQYVAPKLKAVEVKVEDVNKLTPEQMDARIALLLGRHKAATAPTVPTADAGQ